MDGNNGDKLMLVGIGASAGGVEALREFFERMPADTGMAFVVIVHLAPGHESHLAEVLGTRTGMPVEQVREPVRVEPNKVYVIPPERDLYMSDGQIHLTERGEDGARPAPIDLFFRTLADSYKERAIAVVLSGAGADGSVGVRRVKEEGGVCLAQDPSEAEHPEMPRAAVETGAVDFVLPLAAMPEKLVSLRRNAERIQLPPINEPPPDADERALGEVLALLRARTRHDFSDYKRSTLLRRVERRMQVTETEDLPEYLAYIREHPEELPALLSDLLISVTNFFRDPETFSQLENEVMPLLFANKGPDDQVRVWVAGCATGEEAYSLAMLLVERAERLSRPPAIQVFASDIDEQALGRAREGVYPSSVEADISPERLRRYFVREGQYYRVKRELRELVLFAPHNVLRDPPFSKLDLVSCRNLLIYINRLTQARVLEIFHFALRPGGHLFLGSSESAEGLPDLFVPVDKKHRLFRRLDSAQTFRGAPTLPVAGRWEARPSAAPPPTPGAGTEAFSYGELHYRTLEALAPPSVLVNADYEIVHASENAGRFLRLAGGEPSRNLLKMAHPELQTELRSLLVRAEQSDGASRDVSISLDGGRKLVRVSVRPVAAPRTAPGFRLVVFEELPEGAGARGPQVSGDGAGSLAAEGGGGLEPVVQQLEEDLQRTREQLRATVEMYETQAEEFKASNEELQAMNEELRSATEELETGKEELQSVNEELTTLNNEYKERVEEVSRVNSDLQNLMAATQIGTLFLDRQLRIKRYTPGVQDLFNLIPGDVGRPVAHVTHRLDYRGLVEDAESVLRTLHAVEREAGTREGRHYLVRLIPYRTAEDRIDGVVVTFVDITERKRAEEALAAELNAMTRLRELSDRLLSADDLPAPLGEVLDTAIALHAADRGTIQVYDPAIDGLRYAATRGFDAAALADAPPVDRDFHSTCAAAIRTGQWVIVPDILTDPCFADHVATAAALDYRAAFSFPLNTRRGEFLGVLTVHFREPREPEERELRWAALYAPLAAHLIERRRAEEALRESEEQFRRAIEDAPIPVIMQAEDGEVLQISRTWTELTGYSIEDVPTFDAWLTHAYGEGADEVREHMHELFKGDRRSLNIEFPVRTRAGSLRRWSFSASSPGALRDGRRFVVGMALDITERHEAEARLRESEERLRLIVEGVQDYAIFTTDAGGRITSWNVGAERAFGYTFEEALGQHIEIIFTPEDRERGVSEEEMRRAREEGRAPDERWHVSKSGTRFYVSGVTVPLRDEKGAVAGYAKIARDLTERREMEEALRRAHDELEERVGDRTLELAEANVSLQQEVRERRAAEEQVKGLLRQLVTVQEEERRRIARELHDTLGQQLTAMRLSMDMIRAESEGRAQLQEHVRRTQGIFDRLNSDVDFLAWELRPAALDQLGLDAALQSFVREWGEHFGGGGARAGGGGGGAGPPPPPPPPHPPGGLAERPQARRGHARQRHPGAPWRADTAHRRRQRPRLRP